MSIANNIHRPNFSKSDRPVIGEEVTLIDQIEADEPGDGWIGDSVERSWAEAMSHFIEKKVTIALKDGYELYGDDRLMIYDNWPAPSLSHKSGLSYLRKHLMGSAVWSVFRRVYIIDESVILEVSAEQTVYHRVCR